MFNMVFGHVRWQWPVGGESVSQVRHTYHSQTLGLVVTANDSGEKTIRGRKGTAGNFVQL